MFKFFERLFDYKTRQTKMYKSLPKKKIKELMNSPFTGRNIIRQIVQKSSLVEVETQKTIVKVGELDLDKDAITQKEISLIDPNVKLDDLDLILLFYPDDKEILSLSKEIFNAKNTDEQEKLLEIINRIKQKLFTINTGESIVHVKELG